MKKDILIHIAKAVNLREGSEGVRTFLRQVYNNQGISTKACAQNIRLPLPITAALKKEAIKAGLLKEGPTMRLTDHGQNFCEAELGLKTQSEMICPRCWGLRYVVPEELNPVLERLQLYLSLRPKVDVTIDQAHGTPMTALRRAVLALEKGALFNREIALFGDDDLVSIALVLLWQLVYTDQKPPKITVFDLDERLLDYIDNIACELNVSINTVFYDAREDLPQEHCNVFEVIFTDPPYTIPGAALFLTRVKQLLRKSINLPVFFSFGPKAPQDMNKVQEQIIKMGFTLEEIIPGFNEYEGAAILGNTGQMLVLRTADINTPPLKEYKQAIYTNEVTGDSDSD